MHGFTPLSRFKQGAPIKLADGILFTSYATLRSEARDDKAARVTQIAIYDAYVAAFQIIHNTFSAAIRAA